MSTTKPAPTPIVPVPADPAVPAATTTPDPTVEAILKDHARIAAEAEALKAKVEALEAAEDLEDTPEPEEPVKKEMSNGKIIGLCVAGAIALIVLIIVLFAVFNGESKTEILLQQQLAAAQEEKTERANALADVQSRLEEAEKERQRVETEAANQRTKDAQALAASEQRITDALKKADDDRKIAEAEMRQQFEAALANVPLEPNAPAPVQPDQVPVAVATPIGVNTVDHMSVEQALSIMGQVGSAPLVKVTNNLQEPKGDILINTLEFNQAAGYYEPNKTIGRSISVDPVAEDIGTEVPIGYFRFGPEALEIFKREGGLRAVITNEQFESGKLKVVFMR